MSPRRQLARPFTAAPVRDHANLPENFAKKKCLTKRQMPVIKWSSKSPEERRRRVRDNQRRHRERMRVHVAHLEAQLAETQLQLSQAMRMIQSLKHELAGVRYTPSRRTPFSRPDDDSLETAGAAPQTCCQSTLAADEAACCDMEPPDAGESTTQCRDAYRLIKERNFSGWDNDAVRRWLAPGYRGPIAPDGGCRVENMLLFALLDRLTS